VKAAFDDRQIDIEMKYQKKRVLGIRLCSENMSSFLKNDKNFLFLKNLRHFVL
jgi:hypothetical protein